LRGIRRSRPHENIPLHYRQSGSLLPRRTAAAVGIGLDHAGVDGEALPADQSLLHAALDHVLEHMPKRVALPEATMTIL
jgi:hypothetical protein